RCSCHSTGGPAAIRVGRSMRSCLRRSTRARGSRSSSWPPSGFASWRLDRSFQPLPRSRSRPMSNTIEQIKAEGIALDLVATTAQGFEAIKADDFYRLKTYGLCSPRKTEQDFMIRIRVPGGAASAKQVLWVAELAERHARGWVHLSTRQNFELHMVQAED